LAGVARAGAAAADAVPADTIGVVFLLSAGVGFVPDTGPATPHALAPPRPATAATDPHGSFAGTNSAALATEASLDMTCLASLGSDFCDDDCGLAASTGDTDA
jgi:hypothetical protein